MNENRRKSKQISVGKLKMGGDAPISIQSMLNTPAEDFEKSVEQAKRLETAGCEIIRAAIPNMESVKLIEHLKNAVSVPIVADIHLTTVWLWKQLQRVLIRCASIRAISEMRPCPSGGAKLQTAQCADSCRG